MSDEGEQAIAKRGESAPATAGSGGVDAYEAKYMAGQGAVLHRAKARAPKVLQIALLAPAVLSLPSLAAGLLPGLAIVLFSTLMSLVLFGLFAVLRVTVSEGNVNVQYGVFGPTIPIAAIESAEATTYDWKSFGGWGIKRNRQGEWIYNMPGDEGRAVRIVWSDKGKRKVTLVGSTEAQALANAIATARSRALPAPSAAGELTGGDA